MTQNERTKTFEQVDQIVRQRFFDPSQLLTLRIPLAHIESRLPWLRQMAGVKICGRAGPGAWMSWRRSTCLSSGSRARSRAPA